jgi:hypothetical protein
MLEVTRGPMNHLAGRRQGRTPLHHPQLPLSDLARLPGLFSIQDCCLDSGRADVCAAVAEPYIVSHIMTGYIERDPGLANQVVVAAGQDGPTGVLDDADYSIFGSDGDEPV